MIPPKARCQMCLRPYTLSRPKRGYASPYCRGCRLRRTRELVRCRVARWRDRHRQVGVTA